MAAVARIKGTKNRFKPYIAYLLEKQELETTHKV
jgi:hypothetical protein